MSKPTSILVDGTPYIVEARDPLFGTSSVVLRKTDGTRYRVQEDGTC